MIVSPKLPRDCDEAGFIVLANKIIQFNKILIILNKKIIKTIVLLVGRPKSPWG